MSKRQHIKAQRVKKQRNDKLILGGIIAAALVLFGLLVLPNLLPKPVITRPNVQGLAMGDPNAPVKIEQFSDFLCSHCADYALNTEEEIVKNYVATGKVYMKFIPTPQDYLQEMEYKMWMQNARSGVPTSCERLYKEKEIVKSHFDYAQCDKTSD